MGKRALQRLMPKEVVLIFSKGMIMEPTKNDWCIHLGIIGTSVSQEHMFLLKLIDVPLNENKLYENSYCIVFDV